MTKKEIIKIFDNAVKDLKEGQCIDQNSAINIICLSCYFIEEIDKLGIK